MKDPAPVPSSFAKSSFMSTSSSSGKELAKLDYCPLFGLSADIIFLVVSNDTVEGI